MSIAIGCLTLPQHGRMASGDRTSMNSSWRRSRTHDPGAAEVPWRSISTGFSPISRPRKSVNPEYFDGRN